MNKFFLILCRMSKTGKNNPDNNNQFGESADFGHFRPFLAIFGLLWPRYKFLKVLVSILFLVLSGMSESGKKILINNDQFEENADFGHFRLFLACFWPAMAWI